MDVARAATCPQDGGGGGLDVVHERVCGLDVHKRTVVACALVPGEAGTVKPEPEPFSTMLGELARLAGWLAERGVTHVAMEATGVYGKAVYHVLAGADRFTVLVVTPEHVKAIRGRKTDRADAQRLAFLLRHDLLSGSFIPDREQRELRALTRARPALVRERARVVQRREKVLEGANSKLGAVVTELLGTSGPAMLDAALQGVTDPEELAGLAHRKLQPKHDRLVQALAGRLTRPLQGWLSPGPIPTPRRPPWPQARRRRRRSLPRHLDLLHAPA